MWKRRTEAEMILAPRHALVIREALGCLSDFIGWEDATAGWESGLSVFDRLTQGQQQAALLTIGCGLLQAEAAPPEVTAVLAAAVRATYDTLLSLIETDIVSEEHSTDLRQLILAALDEMNYWAQANEGLLPQETPIEPPMAWCEDLDRWGDLINVLRQQVLEDEDYELEYARVADLDPTTAQAVKGLLAIDRDYFVTVPDDPSPAELTEMRQRMLSLLRGDDGSV